MLIAFTSGDIVKDKRESDYEKLAIKILTEYKNIIENL